MRILYIDIDSQRADHLGCYGYHRQTSPNIDSIAAQGVRFDNCYVSDAPCLPSRTALWSGRFGIHTGVVNHGGVAADPFIEGTKRGFSSTLGQTNWMRCLRNLGYRTATVSSFGERHAAWHWYAGFNDIHNLGKFGGEIAGQVGPVAMDWLRKFGSADNWFLHVNFWDPHTPYRTPTEYGEPFKNDPIPDWLTEEVRQKHWNGCGPHSAREVTGFDDARPSWMAEWKRQPVKIDSMQEVRRMFDGYDTGVRYADDYIGRIFSTLADLKIFDDTVIIISADHGENLGELNIYGDHQTADNTTSRVPLIVRWPGVTTKARVDQSFHYSFDFAATMIELLGGQVPEIWDGVSFADDLRQNRPGGRESLVISQMAWSCQRSSRFDDYLCMRTYHDGYHNWPQVMLFNVKNDPHLQQNLADTQPDLVKRGLSIIDTWHDQMMRTATHATDPLQTVLSEGGPYHTRNELPRYLARLRSTGRQACADALAKGHRI